MRQYNYKMQWLFPMNSSFIDSSNVNKKRLFDFLKIIGPKSLTKICFRDKDLKIVSTYSGFIGYPTGADFAPTKKYIIQEIKRNPEITSVELLRS